MPKVLIVDDDCELLTVVTGFLSQQGYLVDAAPDGAHAQDFLAVSGYDVIVLDVALPDTSGLEICKSLRNARNVTPVIMLTGKSSLEDKETGFEVGADDYLTKPFSLRELVARLRALMRRPTSFVANSLRFGNLELNTIHRTLTRNAEEIHLSPIEFSLLELFMKYPQQFFSTDVLLARVWSTKKESTDEAVRASIKRLRRKIDGADVDENESLIESNWSVGYRFRYRVEVS